MDSVSQSVISSTCTYRRAGASRIRRTRPIQRTRPRDMWLWSPLSCSCTSSALLHLKSKWCTAAIRLLWCVLLTLSWVLFLWSSSDVVFFLQNRQKYYFISKMKDVEFNIDIIIWCILGGEIKILKRVNSHLECRNCWWVLLPLRNLKVVLDVSSVALCFTAKSICLSTCAPQLDWLVPKRNQTPSCRSHLYIGQGYPSSSLQRSI